MPIYDLFSNRNRPRPETLVYDSLPETPDLIPAGDQK